MHLTSTSFAEGAFIPEEFAFAAQDAVNHITLAPNRNPHLAWSDVPEGTASFVLVCHDPDAPSDASDVNIEGRNVPADLPRVDFFHWALFDIPAETREIAAGSHSNGITAHGKSGDIPNRPEQHGINDYTGWFAADPDMAGTYFGYDGPCPPWNDARMHHYVFTLYALATPTLAVTPPPHGAAVREAIDPANVLATATLTGLYSLNPEVTPRA